MKKKYVCHSGMVISPNDGDHHVISAHKLPNLYNIDRRLCHFCSCWPPSRHGHGNRWPEDLIHLHPVSSGDYTLPPEAHKKEIEEGIKGLKEFMEEEDEDEDPVWSIILTVIFAVAVIGIMWYWGLLWD